MNLDYFDVFTFKLMNRIRQIPVSNTFHGKMTGRELVAIHDLETIVLHMTGFASNLVTASGDCKNYDYNVSRNEQLFQLIKHFLTRASHEKLNWF
jgi:hypothetical protein